MKKNLIKKLLSAALSAAVVMAMSTSSFAADLSGGAVATGETSVNITKVLKVINPDLSSVDGPGASYSYSIAPAEPSAGTGGTTVTDSGSNSGTVHTGPQGGVTLTSSSVSFPVGTAVSASPAGEDNTARFTAKADLTKFTSPGIYRYAITETPSLGSTGVTDTGDRVRYLDVYIVNGGSGLQVSGFTLHDKDNNKTDGFNGGSSGEGQPFSGQATFETVNVTLTNQVSGNMGDRQNQFPFTGRVEDSGRYFFASKGSLPDASQADQVSGVSNGPSVSTALSDGEVYYISGLSKEALISYTQTNNTADIYQTAITGGNASPASAVSPGGTKEMTSCRAADSGSVIFQNTLDAVSPTGVIFRYGASLAMLIIGAALIIFNRRSRKKASV